MHQEMNKTVFKVHKTFKFEGELYIINMILIVFSVPDTIV